ncbi:MAG TPA: c-type cytochrome, partial [Prosthecobacter sp.]
MRFHPIHLSCFFFPLAAGTGSLVHAADAAGKPAPHPGLAVYQKLCLECHGDRGQGVKGKYDEALIGDRTLEALARKIERTMPEENVGACVGEDARQVAAYIYDAFYSPDAQARAKPPEKDLTRLTIGQYRASVMDLIGRFRQGAGFDRPVSSEMGIKGLYRGFEIPPPEEKKPEEKLPELTRLEELKAAKAEEKELAKAREALRKAEEKRRNEARELAEKKRKERKQHRFERVDAGIAFHYGTGSPDPAKMIPEEFNNRWDGCIQAEETGVYEVTLKTENGVRLYVNDDQEPLIDAWV